MLTANRISRRETSPSMALQESQTLNDALVSVSCAIAYQVTAADGKWKQQQQQQQRIFSFLFTKLIRCLPFVYIGQVRIIQACADLGVPYPSVLSSSIITSDSSTSSSQASPTLISSVSSSMTSTSSATSTSASASPTWVSFRITPCLVSH